MWKRLKHWWRMHFNWRYRYLYTHHRKLFDLLEEDDAK